MAPPNRTKALAQFRRVFSQIAKGIGLCLEHDLKTPALILLYSGIDIAGWMARDSAIVKVQDSFTTWVEKYMQPERSLGCTALDLYGARCGMVHTFTPESKLSGEGKARKVVYAWPPSRVETLREIISLGLMERYVAVQGDDLVNAYQRGILKFLGDLNRLPTERLESIGDRLFTLMPTEEGKRLLAWGKSLLKGARSGGAKNPDGRQAISAFQPPRPN